MKGDSGLNENEEDSRNNTTSIPAANAVVCRLTSPFAVCPCVTLFLSPGIYAAVIPRKR